MQLFDLIAELQEIYEIYGNIPCNFQRTVYNHVSSDTQNVDLIVRANTDDYRSKDLQFILSFTGI